MSSALPPDPLPELGAADFERNAGFERAARRLFEAIEASTDPGLPFAAQVNSALRTSLALLAADPDLAVTLCAVSAADPTLADAFRRWRETFAALLRDAARRSSPARPHPVPVEPFIVAGIAARIDRHLHLSSAETLEDLLPGLLEFVLVYYRDPSEA